jgi:uncharacterized protein YcfJ
MRKFAHLMIAATATVPLLAAVPADAQTYRSSRVHHYHRSCVRGHGTTGTIVGGAAGALVGSAVTHGIAGPIVGAAGGALLGRHIQRHRYC